MTDITQSIQEMRKKYVTRGSVSGNYKVAKTARNATMITEAGEEYIDFVGGVGVMNVGHNHPKVVKAAIEQLENAIHPGFTVMQYAGYAKLAKALCEFTPGTHEKQAVFFNSGAEAVENAIKIARRHTGKKGVLTFYRGFHGRTNLTLSMTTKATPYKVGGPFASDIYRAPFPYMFRKPANMTDDEYIDDIIRQFDEFTAAAVRCDDLAVVVMEPIQGEGGFIAPPKRFVEHVYNFAKEHGALFMADEIQTGYGRTGKNFGMEHYGLHADIMSISKSIAAGFPLSAVVGKKEVMDSANPGEVGGTYSGNAVACAAGLAVIEIMNEENLPAKAEALGAKFEERLKALQAKYPLLGDVRRVGAMVAAEFVTEEGSTTPNPEPVNKIIDYGNENGLLMHNAGMEGNIIRFLAPLTTTDEEFEKGMAILEKGFEAAFK